MNKYWIFSSETAIYEIHAESKEEAEITFESGGGEFIGYDDEVEEAIIKITEEEKA